VRTGGRCDDDAQKASHCPCEQVDEMTSIEEKLIGRISAQLTRAVEEADQAYEFAPGSYTAGALNALLSAQRLVRELASASGCYRD
jgi:hypothetical protein